MKAEIITIGDELLIGQTVDTNSAWIGAELSQAGFDICRKISIHDRREDILDAVSEAVSRYDIVIITGGLGPTSDDITKQTLCDIFNGRMVLNPTVLSMIDEMMKRRGIAMNENNRKQAEVPDSCRVLYNKMGTAPGMWFEKEGTIFISLPGVPYEMKYIMNEHVLPELKKRFQSQVIIHRNIMTYGTSESKLAEILSGFEKSLPPEIKLAYLPSYGIIKLRLTGTGRNREIVENIVDEQVKKLYSIIPQLIYSEIDEPIESFIGNLLKERGLTICTAESCTGGKIAQMLTSIPGSSQYYKGSVIAYDNSIKTSLLNVPEEMISNYGAVSEQVVAKMATEVRKKFRTDYSVATSGIAGPDGGSESKPVGTVCIAVSSDNGVGVITEKYVFGNERILNINRFSIASLNLVRRQILQLQK
ncbi:MAG TPA: competence/damage-inducible protein A [Bacteroidales bacterium]|jgi:nicotinamide-nucleotide amidase|nr:MAG: Nicotinamide-nucleotide amidohydrolase PncC [Bacteroidetes bacterium ADurb.Bin145]HOU01143.1 competence/damage-inducible protein A [Bacteroidales bacterium]HQK68858.1 competence/damage-inducible protein A [Bacteroidales bacterium]